MIKILDKKTGTDNSKIDGKYIPDNRSKELNRSDADRILEANNITLNLDNPSPIRLNLYADKTDVGLSPKRILFNRGHSNDLISRGVFENDDIRFIDGDSQIEVHLLINIDKINKLKNKHREIKMIVFENMITELGTSLTAIKGFMQLIEMYKKGGTPIPEPMKDTISNNLSIFLNLYPQIISFHRRNRSWINRKNDVSGIKALSEHEELICNMTGIKKAHIRRFKPTELKRIRRYITSAIK